MRFCNQCGAPLERIVPPGEDRERPVCTACGHIHYQNPKTVVGCLIEVGGRILLCKRAIEPAHGRWTLPAGYMELDESAVQGAIRETREEANASVRVIAPHAYLDVPHIGQSYSIYRAGLRDSTFSPGEESLEVELFEVERLPWEEIAFPVIAYALRLFIEDRERGASHLHLGVVRWKGEGSRYDFANYRLEDHLAVPLERKG